LVLVENQPVKNPVKKQPVKKQPVKNLAPRRVHYFAVLVVLV
jgi:hypothetical protein